MANAAIAHLLFPTRQANAIKAKEQLLPAARLRSKVLWLHYQRQKRKSGGFATANILCRQTLTNKFK
jgi:hypothetical protein